MPVKKIATYAGAFTTISAAFGTLWYMLSLVMNIHSDYATKDDILQVERNIRVNYLQTIVDDLTIQIDTRDGLIQFYVTKAQLEEGLSPADQIRLDDHRDVRAVVGADRAGYALAIQAVQ